MWLCLAIPLAGAGRLQAPTMSVVTPSHALVCEAPRLHLRAWALGGLQRRRLYAPLGAAIAHERRWFPSRPVPLRASSLFEGSFIVPLVRCFGLCLQGRSVGTAGSCKCSLVKPVWALFATARSDFAYTALVATVILRISPLAPKSVGCPTTPAACLTPKVLGERVEVVLSSLPCRLSALPSS